MPYRQQRTNLSQSSQFALLTVFSGPIIYMGVQITHTKTKSNQDKSFGNIQITQSTYHNLHSQVPNCLITKKMVSERNNYNK